MSGAPAKPGDLVADKYRVERVLGAGAMGMVVSAVHTELLERRALKIMLDPGFEDSTRAERFVREARALARVKSEHVATVHDIGRMKDGAPYIVMELLDGRDLKDVLDVVGKLSVSDAIFLMSQACTGIAAAHALGIVHRDLKPANLFLTRPPDGGTPVLKIVDFGIAKIVGQAGDMEITKDADLLGTPLYMSPEQMRGATQVDPRTDIWALGAILYRMLSGRTPFEGSSVTEICAAVVADDPPSLRSIAPEVPEPIERVVLRCLEKRPDRRFANALELRDALLALVAGPVASATPSASPRPFDPPVVVSSPPTLTTPGLQATLNATSWVQLSASTTAASPAPRPRSKAGIVVAATLAVAVFGGGAFVAARSIPSLTHKKAQKPVAASSVPSMPTPAGLAPGDPSQASSRPSAQPREGLSSSSPVASAPPPPSTSASAAVTASALPSASSSARRAGAPPPVVRPTTPLPAGAGVPPPVYVPPPPPPTDAFGRERK